MAKDPMSRRFDKRQQKGQLSELSRKARGTDDVEAEQELLDSTDKVEPLKAKTQPNRNDPCPCGSGKKYKKCCSGK